MYKKCATCPKLGITCNEFDPLALRGDELREWCKWRLVWLGWGRVRLTTETNMPKSTIDRFLSNELCDFKFETIRPIVKALIGGTKDEHPCPMVDREDDTERLQQEKELLQAECIKLHEETEKIKEYLSTQEKRSEDNLAKFREETASTFALLKDQLRYKNMAVSVLSALVGVLVLAIIAVLIYDKLNPGIGWFRY